MTPSSPPPSGVREVTGALRALGRGCLSTRVACIPGNGLGDLCLAFNEMAGRLEREITARQQAEERLAAREKEKDLLLREIHHRVKNNLQVVSGLLQLQSAALTDPVARQIFRESQARIQTMALIHEGLYRHRDLVTVRMDRYLHQICTHLLASYGRTDGSVSVSVEADPGLALPVDTVTPIGLILNELVSNALKHAFPGGKKGMVRVGLAPGEDGTLSLTVADDGVGLPPEEVPPCPDGSPERSPEKSMGMRLVSMLTEQLRGTLEVVRGGGTRFTLTFRPRP